VPIGGERRKVKGERLFFLNKQLSSLFNIMALDVCGVCLNFSTLIFIIRPSGANQTESCKEFA
jgi:hypothetical protein